MEAEIGLWAEEPTKEGTTVWEVGIGGRAGDADRLTPGCQSCYAQEKEGFEWPKKFGKCLIKVKWVTVDFC